MLTSDLYLEDLKKINEQSLPWKQLENRKVLITGGTGLIGSCFTDALIYRNEHLKSNIDLWVLCRSRANAEKVFGNYMGKPYLHFLFQDVSEPVCIQEQMDYIVHAASKGDPKSFVLDPLGVMNANILGMHRVIEYARKRENSIKVNVR